MSALDKDKLDSIASSAEVNVQSDWNTTNTTNDSFIRNKPTIPSLPTDSEIGDKAFSNPPTDLTNAEKTAARNAIGAGTGSGTGTGEENVQSNWDETDTASDAYIQNKPTIPSLPTDSEIGDKAFSNPPTDLDDAEQANVRTNIGLTNANIGVLAFRNPPGNLTSTQQESVRTAIGAGTGSGTGSTTFTGLTDTPASLGTAGQFLRVNTGATALEFVAAPTGGGGATTFEALTDTPASLGSAGQYLRVNTGGTALEFVAAPTGGGGSSFLPSADNRSTDGGFFYMGWTDDFSNSWGSAEYH